ncbi:MAG: Lrp/AsnC family transcriptional regulator [Nanoarchaeota archaeon]|nr:Lrp/AsnC family transcriptional regulator [Nanoarchaeota archaeon]
METNYILDKIDKKILVILMENSRYSYSTIAKKVGTKREVITYRINRLLKKGIIEKFTTTISWRTVGFNFAPHIYLKLNMVHKKRFNEIIDKTVANPYLIRVAKCEGQFDIYIRALCKDFSHQNLILNEIKEICGLNLKEYEIIESVTDNYANDTFFLDEDKNYFQNISDNGSSFQNIINKTYKKGVAPPFKKRVLEDFELKLLDILENNSRIKIIDIAKDLNVSFMKIKNRIKKLIGEGIIYKFNLILNPNKFGYSEYHLLLCLFGGEENKKGLIQMLKGNKHCRYLALCNGKIDFLFRFEVKDNKELKKVMDDIFLKYSEIIAKYEYIWINNYYKHLSFPKPLLKLCKIVEKNPFISLVHP